MVPPADPRRMGGCIDAVLSEPARHARLGQKAREYVISQRSDGIVAKQTLQVYREALES